MVGVVKWFSNKRGYGYIIDEEGNDLFVHYSDIEAEKKYRTLEEGQRVSYELGENERGKKAFHVSVLSA